MIKRYLAKVLLGLIIVLALLLRFYKVTDLASSAYKVTSIPFVAIFRPGVWGERSLSLISGLGIIILMYFLGKKLFNEKVGLIASFWSAAAKKASLEAVESKGKYKTIILSTKIDKIEYAYPVYARVESIGADKDSLLLEK